MPATMNRRHFLHLSLKAGAASTAVALCYRWLDKTYPVRAAQQDGTPFSVYMTFDDGPTTYPNLTGPTINVLDTLKNAQTSATFFLHGHAINEWEGPVIARMINEGHTVGNHLWRQGGNTVTDDSALALLAQQYIVAEEKIRTTLQAADQSAYAIYLAQSKLFRRPGGNNGLTDFLDPKNYPVLETAKYLRDYKDKLEWLQTVYDYSGWHVNGGDGITDPRIQPNTADKMVKWIFKGGWGYTGVDGYLCDGTPPRRTQDAEGGLIILMHDADKVTDDALSQIITGLKNRGAEFHSLPRPQDQPNTKTVGIGYAPNKDPEGVACDDPDPDHWMVHNDATPPA